jgi:hypothetical protein
MKCADCKYWDREYDDHHNFGLGECEKAKPFWNATEWSKDEDGEDNYIKLSEINPTTLMYVQDGSDYVAYLLTKADFFCAHFEEKVDD